jgi:hypothetical protein
MGSVSDRVGRRPLLIGVTIAILFTAYPAPLWLSREPSFSRLLGVELWLSGLFGAYTGAMVVYLTEIMPACVRTTDLHTVAQTAAFGGFTPAISTYLIHLTGNRAVPGLWLSFAAVCSLAAAIILTGERVKRLTVAD